MRFATSVANWAAEKCNGSGTVLRSKDDTFYSQNTNGLANFFYDGAFSGCVAYIDGAGFMPIGSPPALTTAIFQVAGAVLHIKGSQFNATTAFNNSGTIFTGGGNTGTINGTLGNVYSEAGMVSDIATTFANLGTPANGTSIYCSDCTIANPCASGGTGAFAKRLNTVWVCN